MSNQAGNVIAGQEAGATQGTHESTFRNPSAVYNANVNQDMGGLETGVNKNIAETQSELNKSSANYQKQLQDISGEYKYGGMQDLQDISNPGTFSRLSSLVNPAGEQTKLKGVSSNTANYAPDTSGVAQSSTMGGLSSQLQKQYGTSAGGSRLDALLYRGSGGAGKAINEGLNQINQFNQGKQGMLQGESNLLNQLSQGAVNKSNQLKSEGANYQTQLQQESKNKAQQIQSQYDAQRAAGLQALQNQIAQVDYRKQLEDAINQAFGVSTQPTTPNYLQTPGGGRLQTPTDLTNNPAGISAVPADRRIIKNLELSDTSAINPIQSLTDMLMGQGIDQATATQLANSATRVSGRTQESRDRTTEVPTFGVDLTDYTKQQLLNQFANNINMGQFDPTKYQGEARTFNPDAYLDPRYNLLGQLLGGPQVAGTINPSNIYSQNQQGLTQDINNYLNPQVTQAQEAANALFANQNLSAPSNNPYLSQVKALLNNPIFAGSTIYGAGGVAQQLQNLLQDPSQQVISGITSLFG